MAGEGASPPPADPTEPQADLAVRAPAKVNLTLHVIGRRPDGYHELESLVVFAGVSDRLTLTPGLPLGLVVEGPTAALAGLGADNLVLKAARHLAQRVDGLEVGRFRLAKRLPVAAGLGGGSSDAAAALRLLACLNRLPLDHPSLQAAARATGADVPVCLVGSASMMRGIGERLEPVQDLAPLFAVLVNPRVPVETRPVFERLGLSPGQGLARAGHPSKTSGLIRDDLLDRLRQARNDLEAPAIEVAPVIGEALAVLAAERECRLARMSGSGATVFGLFDDCRAAARAAGSLRRAKPGWWIKATVLR